MNILFCIGKNYRDFEPLNSFAQRFVRDYFGEIHQIVFCDSLESEKGSNEALSLKQSLKFSTNLLVLSPNDSFNKILTLIESQGGKIDKETPAEFADEILIKMQYKAKDKACKVWLLDLQNIFANQAESQIHTQLLIESQFHQDANHRMFLYLLGIDVDSAQMLLGGIAKDFGVTLDILNADSNLDILSATSHSEKCLKEFAQVVESTFAYQVFPTFNLAQSIISLLSKHNLKITAAESCTGGLIAHWLTKEGGASTAFDGSVISYANAIKEAWLGVSVEHLIRFGAVSEAVVREMLEGALRLSGADFALATSGIAGPSGGSTNKPIGTVFIGVKDKKGTERIEQLHFKGDRNYIQAQATLYAYLLFLKVFLSNY